MNNDIMFYNTELLIAILLNNTLSQKVSINTTIVKYNFVASILNTRHVTFHLHSI